MYIILIFLSLPLHLFNLILKTLASAFLNRKKKQLKQIQKGGKPNKSKSCTFLQEPTDSTTCTVKLVSKKEGERLDPNSCTVLKTKTELLTWPRRQIHRGTYAPLFNQLQNRTLKLLKVNNCRVDPPDKQQMERRLRSLRRTRWWPVTWIVNKMQQIGKKLFSYDQLN